MAKKKGQNMTKLEKLSLKVTRWIGTPQSVIVHTLIFLGIPSLSFFGFDFRAVTLLLTTWLSMEAIYLAIFIQMTVNRNTQSIEEIEDDIEELSEDVEDIQEDIGEFHEEKPTVRSRISKILQFPGQKN